MNDEDEKKLTIAICEAHGFLSWGVASAIVATVYRSGWVPAERITPKPATSDGNNWVEPDAMKR
jgi:hypothetical protein